jgi:ribosomal protein L15
MRRCMALSDVYSHYLHAHDAKAALARGKAFDVHLAERRQVFCTVLKLVLCQAREKAAESSGKALVIDVTKHGIFKVLGKGVLPEQPVLVKAKFVSKLAEQKIRDAGGAVELVA